MESSGSAARDGRSVLDGLRAWGAVFAEYGRVFGSSAGLHSTDSAALIEIIDAEDKGVALTQAQLARTVGLTPSATSSLITRLEEAGHVVRHRERADRRVVTLRSTPAVHERVDHYFAPSAARLEGVLAGYPDETRAAFAGLVRDLVDVMHEQIASRRSEQAAPPGSPRPTVE